jgi:two-component system sensor histidine kinase SenX3
MTLLADHLIQHADAIVDRWYERWCQAPRSHPDLPETALKDRLPVQLRVIGEQLRELDRAENPEDMWKVTDRLHPEARVEQDFPIEELVKEYRVLVDTVRGWIKERGIQIDFQESSYFYAAIFELVAESVRRYATHQAERVRTDRAQYLAGVMHQLRTPLSAMLMQVELLDRRDHPPDASAVSRLRRNVRRIRTLVDGVLRLERYQPSEIPFRREEVHLVRLIDGLMSDYESDAAQKGLRFEAHVNRSLRLTTDPDLLVDALGNLVQNAVKFTTDGFVIVHAEERPDAVVFHVRDSGPGIPEDQQRTLFKQLQPGTGGGAGLGLQIARHAAEAMEGHIEVQSAPGRGSVFSLHVRRVARLKAGEQAG